MSDDEVECSAFEEVEISFHVMTPEEIERFYAEHPEGIFG